MSLKEDIEKDIQLIKTGLEKRLDKKISKIEYCTSYYNFDYTIRVLIGNGDFVSFSYEDYLVWGDSTLNRVADFIEAHEHTSYIKDLGGTND